MAYSCLSSGTTRGCPHGSSSRTPAAGSPTDQLPFIFDRFRTGDDGQSRGTGLGLPLVRAVARAHGGDVTVRSASGKGSEFELTLPVPGRPALPAAAAPARAAGRPGARRPDGGRRR